MKARHFRRLRKKFQNSDWVAGKYRQQLERSRELNSFEMFECSDFFRGYDLAEYNREIHRKAVKRNQAKLRYLNNYL